MKAKTSTRKSNVRIIGGEHKRRSIGFVSANGLRPTPDRLRETIFNWLQPYIESTTSVLDLCSGSGAFGFECLSRGSKHGTLIEPHKPQFKELLKSANDLSLNTKTEIHNCTAQQFLQKQGTGNQQFDIIFIDPPYSMNLWNELLSLIIEKQLYHEDTIFYIEADKEHVTLDIDESLMSRLSIFKEKKVGQIYSGLYYFT